ncbi:acyltransferase family protein [Azohydromonas lata]|uniref:Acyltransferase family protein n=1 Tax=Azohydromonas lata TaxID=45677 RepID=A0ABU5IM76_9BURK|nr:acyltransferase family protein [Azohydromonas lata]MDZ5460007.1 acyltransferase family protein [Azohydromonas lata]
MKSAASRWAHVDALKAVACQLIVLHHLAFYGPMSDVASPLAPGLFEWLSQHARVAVQVFLVLGGFLAARSLAPQGRLKPQAAPWGLLGDRYARLVLPYAAMLLIAIAASALAGEWMEHDSISNPPRPAQLLAHVLLLHDLLDFEALSAGVWYVAIDFQLYAMLLGLLALGAWMEREGGLRRRMAPGLVLLAVGGSLLYFNLQSGWDEVAPYFFGAYGLGVLVAWWSGPRPRKVALVALGVLVVVALATEFRERVAVAALVALLLGVLQWRPHWVPKAQGRAGRAMAYVSRISYGVFLVHFPVCLVVNAAFTAFMPAEPLWQALGIAVAWGSSLCAGALFHHHVELRAMAWIAARKARVQGHSGSYGLR